MTDSSDNLSQTDHPGPAAKGARERQNPDAEKTENPRAEKTENSGRKKNGAGRRKGKGPEVVVKPTAGAARPRKRHIGLLLSFVLLVLLPIGASAFYLWTVAVDQYASKVGFTVRREDMSAASDMLGGLSKITGGGGSSDSDILYEFIQSQEMVQTIDRKLDLRSMYSKPWPDDPVFGFNPDGTIEDLVDHWQRMVKISYDPGTGLIELRVLAFSPRDAETIASTIFAESTRMINELSAQAREDATRYAKETLDQSVERLKKAREAITAFRTRNQIVDPKADVQGQMGLLNTLQQQLANALIELDLVRQTAGESDPRISQAQRRIDVIRQRIKEERDKFGVNGSDPDGRDYADILSKYESLSVDREFAERAYTRALGAFDSAQAEARRQSRYLAAYVRPTHAEKSQYPQRFVLLGLVALFAFLAWTILALVYYSIRDRR